ncbi:hypothetical protein DFH06DRAFT_1298313 [Mycena polygramma]|nr:hypothetical protein DFH06DRAFT_1298313 [Mycena polygramma]
MPSNCGHNLLPRSVAQGAPWHMLRNETDKRPLQARRLRLFANKARVRPEAAQRVYWVREPVRSDGAANFMLRTCSPRAVLPAFNAVLASMRMPERDEYEYAPTARCATPSTTALALLAPDAPSNQAFFELVSQICRRHAEGLDPYPAVLSTIPSASFTVTQSWRKELEEGGEVCIAPSLALVLTDSLEAVAGFRHRNMRNQ